ncbi:MAG: hypothetical protein HPY80_11080 [Bacteroidales bacterium]|nr:hypothetical protein [Bacteroidales bacterium]
MNKISFAILGLLTVFGLPFPLFAQLESQPTFHIYLNKGFSLENVLNYEEIEAVIKGNTLNEKGIKLTLSIDEYFSERNQRCNLPVLKANLPRKKISNSILKDFNKFDILFICNDSNNYNELDKLLLEVLMYQLSGIVFHFEPRTLLVNLHIEGLTEMAIPALLVESPDDIAARYEGQNLELHLMQSWLLDQEAWTEFVLFQYFAGNNCWTLETLHSMILLSVPGRPPVPFPWDHSCARLLNEPLTNDWGIQNNYCLKEDIFKNVKDSLLKSKLEILESIEKMPFSTPELKQWLHQYTIQFFENLENTEYIKGLGIICSEE